MSRIALIGENSSVYVSLLIDIWNNHVTTEYIPSEICDKYMDNYYVIISICEYDMYINHGVYCYLLVV